MAVYGKNSLVVMADVFLDNDPTSATFNQPMDPTDVFLTYKIPGSAPTVLHYLVDAALVKDGTGRYHADVNANVVGTWKYHFYSTGLGQASMREQTFTIEDVI